jgi:TPP-dependent pyruvate/acetoin dehydrogenase alpha subunit
VLERARLIESGDATDAELEALEARVGAQIDEIVERALAAPYPDPGNDPVATEYRAA